MDGAFDGTILRFAFDGTLNGTLDGKLHCEEVLAVGCLLGASTQSVDKRFATLTWGTYTFDNWIYNH